MSKIRDLYCSPTGLFAIWTTVIALVVGVDSVAHNYIDAPVFILDSILLATGLLLIYNEWTK